MSWSYCELLPLSAHRQHPAWRVLACRQSKSRFYHDEPVRQAAYQCAERWRQALQSTAVKYDGKEISVTMSVGIAGVLPGGETPEEALSAADNAMYRAKVNGRNCVALFRPYP